MPAVSVVIPTFNRRHWVAASVQTALLQDFRDIEVIVVDDGSTDGTAPMLAEMFGDQIRIERLPINQGRSTARNVGWALASADVVAFLDSDDLWLPDKLSRQMPHFADPDVGLVHCWVAKTDESGARLDRESRELAAQFAIAERRGYDYGGITRTWCRMYTSAVVVRRDALRKTGGFDSRLSNFEDLDLLWRLARYGKVATVRDALVLHRTHPDNTPTIWHEAAIPWLAVNRKHLSDLDASPMRPEDRRARANFLLNMALGEYWRRDLTASRRWMWRALAADIGILRQPAHPVWCTPLLHALLPHRLADAVAARLTGEHYRVSEAQTA